MVDKICMHCVISGRVQGVWFRASTQEKAKELKLTGWVRNLPGGQVEVLACGPAEKIKELHQWLHKGPSRAEVKEVEYEERPWEEHVEFRVV